jgi:hypothetical protein
MFDMSNRDDIRNLLLLVIAGILAAGVAIFTLFTIYFIDVLRYGA